MASKKPDRRTLGLWLWQGGRLLGGGGALVVLAGSVAPWVLFSLFGVPLAAPGVVFAGAWSAAAGWAGMAALRRAPLLAAIAGIIALGIGMSSGKTAVRSVSKQILSLRLRLSPINARLEQIHLAPIEPFGDVAKAEPGPGPGWVILGGALLALGGASATLGERWRRCCPQCRMFWPDERLASLLHCPGCGLKRTNARQCTRCWHVAHGKDTHCATCGDILP